MATCCFCPLRAPLGSALYGSGWSFTTPAGKKRSHRACPTHVPLLDRHVSDVVDERIVCTGPSPAMEPTKGSARGGR